MDATMYEAALIKARKQVNDFKAAHDLLQSTISKTTGVIGKMASGVASVSTVLKVAKDAFMASETNIDAWGSTVEQAKAAYNTFVITLNNGDWSNFFDNLSQAIDGAKQLYDAFDRLGSIKANNAAAIALERANLATLKRQKAEGKQVDEQIKASQARLDALNKQATEQGKKANRIGGRETLQMYSPQLTDKQANDVFNYIITNGQKAVDYYTDRYNKLVANKNNYKTTKIGFGADARDYQEFDVSKLNKQDRLMYYVGYAVKEGETALQEFIGGMANTINEEASNLKEGAKNIRMASGGNKGVSKVGKAVKDAQKSITTAKDMFAWQLEEQENDLDYIANKDKIQEYSQQLKFEVERAFQYSLHEDDEYWAGYIEQLKEVDEQLKKNAADQEKWKENMEGIAAGFGALGDVFGSFDNKGMQALSKSMLMAEAVAVMITKLKTAVTIWDYIAGIGAGMASIVSAFASLNFAEGGVVGGKNYQDGITARVSSGEMIINEHDQKNLYDSIHSGTFGGGSGVTRVKGEDLIIAINNAASRKGLGTLKFSH